MSKNNLAIALPGAAGKMGQMIASLVAEDSDVAIIAASEHPQSPAIGQSIDTTTIISDATALGIGADGVIIDFTRPEASMRHIDIALASGTAMVIGTTGLSAEQEEVLKKAAMDFGIPSEKILLTTIVSNTAEEAEAVKSVIQSEGIESILLITSSFHMPRAELLFRQQDIELETFPVDFKALGKRISWLDFFPSASGFNQTSNGVREYIGRAYYSLRFALESG